MQTQGRATDVRRGSRMVVGLMAAALLAGCATAYDPAAYSAGGHLQARIYQPASGALQFAVSQPAYAAVFAIIPGRGAILLYPNTPSEAQRRLAPGTHSYVGSGFSRSRLSYAGGTGSISSMSGPTTLILIASDAPLYVDRLMRQPALMGDLGLASFYSHASERAVDQLAALIIPDPANTDWTYDTYTVWPEERARQIAAYRVVCADGRVVVVTRGVPRACAEGPAHEPPADTASVPADDSVRAAPPKRPLQLPTRSGRNPRRSAGEQAAEAREGGARLGPRDEPVRVSPRRERESQPRARQSQPRSAPAPRVQAAPPRERRQAEPARQKPAERSERSDRSRRAPDDS